MRERDASGADDDPSVCAGYDSGQSIEGRRRGLEAIAGTGQRPQSRLGRLGRDNSCARAEDGEALHVHRDGPLTANLNV